MGVSVYGKEWSYGWTSNGSGLWDEAPGQCELHTYKETVSMGWTRKSPQEVEDLIRTMRPAWPGQEYDMLRKNCCTFSNEFCTALGVGEIPRWLYRLARLGAGLGDFGKTLNKPLVQLKKLIGIGYSV